jgi:hypothetical protein
MHAADVGPAGCSYKQCEVSIVIITFRLVNFNYFSLVPLTGRHSYCSGKRALEEHGFNLHLCTNTQL